MPHPEVPLGPILFDTASVFHARSRTGRPLDELASHQPRDVSDAMRRDGISTVYRQSTYRGSREPKGDYDVAYNASALSEVFDGAEGLYDGMAWVRRTVFDDDPPEVPTMHDLQRLSQITVAIPAFLMLRKKQPIPRDQLPVDVSLMFKAGMGITGVADAMILGNAGDQPSDGDTTQAWAEGTGLLLGKELPQDIDVQDRRRSTPATSTEVVREGCAAPAGLIAKTIDALTLGEGGDPERSLLNELIPDTQRLIDFTYVFFLEQSLRREFVDNKVAFVTEILEKGGVLDDELLDSFFRYGDEQRELVRTFGLAQGIFNATLGYSPEETPDLNRQMIEEKTDVEVHKKYPKEVVKDAMDTLVMQLQQRREMYTESVFPEGLDETHDQGPLDMHYDVEEHGDTEVEDPQIGRRREDRSPDDIA